MAQFSIGQNDLKNALLRLSEPAVGVRCLSNLIKVYLRKFANVNFANNSNTWLCLLLELFLNFTIEKCSDSFDNQCKKYFDKHPPFQLEEEFLTGSWSEGLFLFQPGIRQPPDMDFMCTLKNISFSEEDQRCGNLMLKDDTPYVNAYLSEPELIKTWEDFLEHSTNGTNKRQLSSKKLKSRLHENYEKIGKFYIFADVDEECKILGDGPSLEVSRQVAVLPDKRDRNLLACIRYLFQRLFKDVFGSSDIVLSIRCNGWPENAKEWILRDRLWPDKVLVQKVCRSGFHIVAKRSCEGNFRLSFSQAEATLIENLTPLQHKVMRAFKAVVKYYQIVLSPNIEEIISTYHLKTIAFWHFEKSTQDSWNEDNIVSHLLSLLDKLAESLRKRHLSMYFLPKYNLLENVENTEEIIEISKKMKEIFRDIAAIKTAVDELENFELIEKMFSRAEADYLEIFPLLSFFLKSQEERAKYLNSAEVYKESDSDQQNKPKLVAEKNSDRPIPETKISEEMSYEMSAFANDVKISVFDKLLGHNEPALQIIRVVFMNSGLTSSSSVNEIPLE